MLLNSLVFDPIKKLLDVFTEMFDLQDDEEWTQATDEWFSLLKHKIYNWSAEQDLNNPVDSKTYMEFGQAMIAGLRAGLGMDEDE